MLINGAIAQAVALTGQVVDNVVLARWLSELDGRLAFEFYRADAWTPYDPEDDLQCELLVPFPWDGMYVHHLAAQTYFADGEYDRYENERVMCEKVLADFRAFMQRTQAKLCGCGFPTEKSGGTGITVIPGDECHSPWFWLSAYALAVKHGYKGTEDEWIEEQRVYAQTAADAAETAQNSAVSAAASAGNAERDAGTAAADAAAAESAKAAAASASASAVASAAAAGASEAAAEESAADSEAWAVGQRDGVDVPTTDETYHNNAKYWAGQAESAAGGGVLSFNGRTGYVEPQAGDYTASDVGAVPTTRKVNGKALSADVTLSASDVGADPAGTAAAMGATKQNTITALGVLEGSGNGVVTAKTVDSTPDESHTANLISSAGVANALSTLKSTTVNPNLLDNWYFVGGGGDGAFPINQRGQTQFTNTGWTIDNWYFIKTTDASSVVVASDGITLTGNDWGGVIDTKRVPVNTTMTFSLLTAGGTLGSITFTFNGTTNQTIYSAIGSTGVTSNFIYNWSNGTTPFFLQAPSGVKIAAVKLELGDTQTLAHNTGTDASPVWVLNEIPDYAETLMRCLSGVESINGQSNVYGGTLPAGRQKLLWTNSAPNADFASQTISIPGSDQYSGFYIVYATYKTNSGIVTAYIPNIAGQQCGVSAMQVGGGASPFPITRGFTPSADSIAAAAARTYNMSSDSYTENNAYVVPRFIYGVF